MGLIASVKSALSWLRGDGVAKPKLQRIGSTSPICPFCEYKLAKMPVENEKCPGCGEVLYIRPRPIDEKMVVLTESQLQVVEEQWAIADGSYEEQTTQRNAPEHEPARKQHRRSQQRDLTRGKKGGNRID
jgi:hypothetical protein